MTSASWQCVALSLPFPFNLQPVKTSTTQQRCLCSTQQDIREFHTSKGGWTETRGRGRTRRNSRGGACDPGPSAMITEPAAPENLVTSGEAEYMTPASQPKWCPWPKRSRRQWQWAYDPVLPVMEMPITLAPPTCPYPQWQCLWAWQPWTW